MLLIFEKVKRTFENPKPSTAATNWHDGQFAHGSRDERSDRQTDCDHTQDERDRCCG
jgi:hypothetical protein